MKREGQTDGGMVQPEDPKQLIIDKNVSPGFIHHPVEGSKEQRAVLQILEAGSLRDAS